MVYQHGIEENGVFNWHTIFIFCNGFNTITPIIRLAIWYMRTLQSQGFTFGNTHLCYEKQC